MKKILSLVLVVSMLLGVTGLALAEDEQTYIQRVGYTPLVDKLTIQTTNRVIPEGNEVDLWFENQLGVEIDWIILSGDELSTKLNLLAASGEMPDVITMPSGSNASDYFSFIDQGLLIDIEELINKVGDNIKKVRTPEQIEALRHTDGHLYAITSGTEPDYDMTMIRRDWYEALGFEMPTTLDEFTELMRAFKTQDPDGNGEDDTYGYYTWGTSNLIQAFNVFWGAFDANPL